MIQKIKKLLAEFLGVDIEDINDDDAFKEDLHMSPSDLTDFVETLIQNGFETDEVNLTEIETVADLAENITETK